LEGEPWHIGYCTGKNGRRNCTPLAAAAYAQAAVFLAADETAMITGTELPSLSERIRSARLARPTEGLPDPHRTEVTRGCPFSGIWNMSAFIGAVVLAFFTSCTCLGGR
jgi:hypothetical protein